MKTVAMGLFLGSVLLLFFSEPLIAATVGLLAFALYQELVRLERRIDGLDPKTAPAAASAPHTARPTQRASASRAPVHRPAAGVRRPLVGQVPTPARRPVAIRETVWDRWTSASLGELEELVAGRALAVVGGIALFLGGIFFLGLAFSRGWIGPELRVGVGLVAGVVLFGLGGWMLLRPRQAVAHVLVAVGLGVFSLALFAATRLYGFFPPEFGVGGALVAAAGAATLAVFFNAPLVAAFGLVAVLASPPVMGASASPVTLGFIGAALAGTTSISVFRSWRWLPPLAFVLSAPQFAAYLFGEPPVAIGLGALAGFWALNSVGAAGEELRSRRYELSPSSATVLLATAAFIVAGGFVLLDGRLEDWRGLYLLGVAVAHFGLAAVFLVRETDRHPFGMLAAGSGIAAVTMAVPIQLGAEWVPLAWAAEAVALAWIYVERRHLYSGLVAAILGTMAAGHILAIEYPFRLAPFSSGVGVPFVNADGMALAFVVGAAAVAVAILRARHERIAITAVAATLVAIAVPHELSGWQAVLALTVVVATAIVVQRAFLDIQLTLPAGAPPARLTERSLYGAAGIGGLILAAEVLESLGPDAFASRLGSTEIAEAAPFINEASFIALVVAAGALSVALVCPGRWRPAAALAAAAIVAYLLPFQLGAAFAVVGWSSIAVLLLLGRQWVGAAARWAARAFAAAAALLTVVVAASPDRLWVDPSAMEYAAVMNAALLTTLAVGGLLAARAVMPPADDEKRWAAYAAGAVGVYALSIAVVDLFQAQLGGPIALEELQKQAQVAVSVLWAVIGALATFAGLRMHRARLRLAGLALLSIVTLKVFIFDLAALDIAYRVLSFVALGILLLVAAYLYGRMQPRMKSSGTATGR